MLCFKIILYKMPKNGHEAHYCKAHMIKPYNAFVSKKVNYAEEPFENEVMQYATVNNKTTRCLRDTGSSISLIKKGLIPDLEMLSEFTVCTTAFNSRHTIPLAMINIAT